MPRKPPRLYPEHDPVHRFALRLRELHRAAGKPTRVQLARQMHCSASTVTHVLNGDRFPSWPQVVALVKACGASAEQFHEAWMRADADNESTHRSTHYQRLAISGRTLPLYVVCDVSSSLAPQVPALNQALLRLSWALGNSPRSVKASRSGPGAGRHVSRTSGCSRATGSASSPAAECQVNLTLPRVAGHRWLWRGWRCR
jgi:hypothetical protein